MHFLILFIEIGLLERVGSLLLCIGLHEDFDIEDVNVLHHDVSQDKAWENGFVISRELAILV